MKGADEESQRALFGGRCDFNEPARERAALILIDF
jgi:hypothetical protein